MIGIVYDAVCPEEDMLAMSNVPKGILYKVHKTYLIENPAKAAPQPECSRAFINNDAVPLATSAKNAQGRDSFTVD